VSSQKTERLINLTLALLATKRHLSKSEIFSKIPGYEGSQETKERMFERDKEELRALGIQIEVSSSDPLFEDDLGYLIDGNSMQFGVNEFSKEELLLLTMAANLWHESTLEMDSKSALLKIQSLSGPVDSDVTSSPRVRLNEDTELLMKAFSAIENSQTLGFVYAGKDRVVKPYGLITNGGFWYLIADEKGVVKSFKMVRIEGKLTVDSIKNSFIRPSELSIPKFFEQRENSQKQIAILRIRKESALALRDKFEVKILNDEWDELLVPYRYEDELIELVLWYGTEICLVEPNRLRDKLIENLRELVNG
jgi:proteasome accessory factor B